MSRRILVPRYTSSQCQLGCFEGLVRVWKIYNIKIVFQRSVLREVNLNQKVYLQFIGLTFLRFVLILKTLLWRILELFFRKSFFNSFLSNHFTWMTT